MKTRYPVPGDRRVRISFRWMQQRLDAVLRPEALAGDSRAKDFCDKLGYLVPSWYVRDGDAPYLVELGPAGAVVSGQDEIIHMRSVWGMTHRATLLDWGRAPDHQVRVPGRRV